MGGVDSSRGHARPDLGDPPDGADGTYREVIPVPRGETVSPVALALAPLRTASLFATLGEQE
ncbi:MAG: hypothetical protein ACR2IP_07225 [Solirubrobacteraceae bacterium]|nr:MAG: hypothetical protein DLM63_08190 [Solirubrobacterales bacterium]